MPNKMLIDAAHPEETRVVVVKGTRVEEFDYESANKKQLRGNIYLAKVTRVEPSLQAAFVDYGGNRHGFLAFTEIHPDYYQIPVADRQALIEEEAAEQGRASAEEAAEDEAAAGRRGRRGRGRRGRGRPEPRQEAPRQDAAAPEPLAIATFELDDEDEIDTTPRDDGSNVVMEASDLVHEVSEPADPDDDETEHGERITDAPSDDDDDDEHADHAEAISAKEGHGDEGHGDEDHGDEGHEEGNGEEAGDRVESVGSEDALEELPERTPRRKGRRAYKIQEVIRRRQIILVQVVKEERGNKGAALTTYLSLAGRYTVLMPNTARGGGISRKIDQPTDRKRLREIAGELEVPEGMGLIIRTAGAQRTKTEIKRDYDYLLRLWENVRDLTLKSTAPALVYEEGSLIKRSIRDLYNKDIDEVLVAGDEAYREAKDFMRMLMPSHAKNVKPYKEPEPVFIRFQVERQLGAMFSPQVTLKSGGYIVINQTEALVSVDVNSGKATREHNIEDTALKTNLEASDEVARQLRLRDLAGLIVIDFIDMDERRNNRLVEKRLKDALRNDRARIQVGRISHFGLMEMSRQRLRTGMLEGSTNACAMCQGTGIVRSVESIALDILRSVEDRLITDGVIPLAATTSVEVALYILNQKRAHLKDIEARYRVPITVTADKEMHISQFVIERGAEGAMFDGESAVVHMDWAHHRDETAAPPPSQAREAREAPEAREAEGDGEGEQGKRRSRRRRGRGRRGEGGMDAERPAAAARDRDHDKDPDAETADEDAVAEDSMDETAEAGAETQPRKSPRRRGRRGGRRGRSSRQHPAAGEQAEGGEAAEASSSGEEHAGEKAPARHEERPNGKSHEARPQADEDFASEVAERRPRREPEPAFSVASAREEPVPAPKAHVESGGGDQEPSPRRRGWWSRG